MPEHTYKLVELVGSSTTGIEDAIQSAISRAARWTMYEPFRHAGGMSACGSWFEVTEPSRALPTVPRAAGTL